jgi:hypothetical protein
MHWYLAKMVFRITCGHGRHKAQFDEQVRLIQASHSSEALEKARRFAAEESRPAAAMPVESARWSLVDIPELYRLQGMVDGAELFSRITEEEDGILFEELVRRRADMLRYNVQHQILEAF